MSNKASITEKFITALKPISQLLTGVEVELKSRSDEPKLPLTSLPTFNRKIWGLKEGLTIIGGRTSQGKSAFALQIAHDLADQQKEVLFLSLEMSVDSMVERLFCNVMEVDNFDMLTGKLKTEFEYQAKWKTFTGLMKIPLILSCGIGKTFQELNEIISLLEPKPRVIIIDYVQGTKGQKNEREDLNEYIRSFRELCLKNGIAGVLCSQVSRAVFEEGNKEPALANLKGCIHPQSFVMGKTIKGIVEKTPNTKIKSYDTNKGKVVSIIPSRYVHSGKKRCLKITTKSGKEIILSRGTELYDGRVWRQARSYVVGNKILVDFSGDERYNKYPKGDKYDIYKRTPIRKTVYNRTNTLE